MWWEQLVMACHSQKLVNHGTELHFPSLTHTQTKHCFQVQSSALRAHLYLLSIVWNKIKYLHQLTKEDRKGCQQVTVYCPLILTVVHAALSAGNLSHPSVVLTKSLIWDNKNLENAAATYHTQ